MMHQPMDVLVALFSAIVGLASFVLASLRKKAGGGGFSAQMFTLMGIFWIVMSLARFSSAMDAPQAESARTIGLNLLTIGLGIGMIFAGAKPFTQSTQVTNTETQPNIETKAQPAGDTPEPASS